MNGLFRTAEDDLHRWYRKRRRKPLVIRGARQVGKSTLVRRFAEAAGLRLAVVNLERHPRLERVFRELQTRTALAELEATADVPLGPGTLLFLDEIQATPSALPLLRYLYEDHPQLAVVAAGSLLEFTLGRHDFSMPVGRIEYLHLGPMDFGEFLDALEETPLHDRLRQLGPGEPLPEAAHRRLLDLQRQFLLVGGLPEAVAEYAATRSLVAVADVQQTVLSTYKDDFAKYARGHADLARLQTVFEYVPSAVGRKTKYAGISREDRAREVKRALQMLSSARVITQVYHSDCSGLPLEAQRNLDAFKCLFLDIGLVNRALGLDAKAIGALDERQLVNEGSLAEQFVGQHLLYAQPRNREPSLSYWLREGRSANAEVDYVISVGDWIVPIEVKAGRTGSLKSLHEFVAAKSPPIAVRFDLGQPSLASVEHALTRHGGASVSYCMLSLPLYLVNQLPRLVEALR